MKNFVQATCPAFGRSTEVETYGGINVAREPELKDRVKDIAEGVTLSAARPSTTTRTSG